MPFLVLLTLIMDGNFMEACKNEPFSIIDSFFLCGKNYFPPSHSLFFHLLASVHMSSSLFSTPTVLVFLFFFHLPVVGWWVFGVMIAWHVVLQLLVIRSNIISKAINGRQYSCVFYSFFHSSLNILTSLLFIHTGSGLITFRENVIGRDGGE